MNSVHTFCDFAQLPVQQAANEFGSKSSTLFQSASTFPAAAGSAKAYAVVDGLCAIQPVGALNSGLVNIILKPTNEVFEDVSVAYIILRGINQSAFYSLDASQRIQLAAFANSTNQWVRRISENQAAYNAEMQLGNPSHAPESLTPACLGLAPDAGAWATTDALETLFTACSLQKVKAGWAIGEFAAGASIEIILQTDTWTPTIGYAQQAAGQLALTYQAGQARFDQQQVEDFSLKQQREQALAFLDPATFYALFAEAGQVKNVSGTAEQVYAGQAIQTNVLAKFNAAGKVYLDLRNHLAHSLNFYNDYAPASQPSAQVQLAGPAGNSWVTKPYHDGNGWPLLVLRPADLAQLGFSGTGEMSLRLRLPEQAGGHPIVFVATSHLFRGQKQARQEFMIPAAGQGGFGGEVPLRLVNAPGTSQVLGTYLKLAYFIRYDVGQFANTPFDTAKLVKQDTLDNLLSLSTTSVNRPAGSLLFRVNNEVSYIGCTSLTRNTDYLIKKGEATDDIGSVFFSYFTKPSEFEGEASLKETRISLNLLSGLKKDNFINYLQTTASLARVEPADIQEAGNTHECLFVNAYSNVNATYALAPSADSMLLVALTTAQRQQLTSLYNTNFLENSICYLVAKDHVLAEDTDGVGYFSFSLSLQGITASTNVSTAIKTADTAIRVFSRDGKAYFSTAYVVACRQAGILNN